MSVAISIRWIFVTKKANISLFSFISFFLCMLSFRSNFIYALNNLSLGVWFLGFIPIQSLFSFLRIIVCFLTWFRGNQDRARVNIAFDFSEGNQGSLEYNFLKDTFF